MEKNMPQISHSPLFMLQPGIIHVGLILDVYLDRWYLTYDIWYMQICLFIASSTLPLPSFEQTPLISGSLRTSCRPSASCERRNGAASTSSLTWRSLEGMVPKGTPYDSFGFKWHLLEDQVVIQWYSGVYRYIYIYTYICVCTCLYYDTCGVLGGPTTILQKCWFTNHYFWVFKYVGARHLP